MKNNREIYEQNIAKYSRLKQVMLDTLNQLFIGNAIELFSLEGRIKTLNSFIEKIERKNYINPLSEMEDICGVRVICYYSSDLEIIESILKSEFSFISSSDKQKESGADRFGYSSRHYIICLKEEWLYSPLYRDLSGLKIEIQVRTILMHTWAAISHKLMYKKESSIPVEINRKLNRLSALIELADEQFDSIRILNNEYAEKLKLEPAYYENDLLNPFNIISLINKHTPGREYTDEDIMKFVDEIDGLNITVKFLDKFLSDNIDLILQMENNSANKRNISILPYWSVTGFCRAVLDLASDAYFKWRWGKHGVMGSLSPELKSERQSFRQRVNH